MKIFGMGGLELVIILVVILLIFGPKNLPKLGQAFGKTVSNLRAGMNEGKKKETDEVAPEEPETVAAAELEGQVVEAETVAFDDVEEAVAAADDAASDIADAAASAVDEAAAAVDEAFGSATSEAPKRVKRVVRKKVD